MKTKYFVNCKSLAKMNARYNTLVNALGLEHLPLENELRKEIHDEYNSLKTEMESESKVEVKNSISSDPTAKEMAGRINSLGLEGEICGSWLWISSPEASQSREKLKSLGFRYSSSKRAWYYRKYEHRSTNSNPISIDAIRDLYGSVRIGQ